MFQLIIQLLLKKQEHKRGICSHFRGAKMEKMKEIFRKTPPFFPIASTPGCHNMTSLQSPYPIPYSLDPRPSNPQTLNNKKTTSTLSLIITNEN